MGFAQVSAQKRGANLGHPKVPAALLYLRGAQGGCCPNFERDPTLSPKEGDRTGFAQVIAQKRGADLGHGASS